jgi:hypothetical protein
MMRGYDSTREGAEEGSKGLPISINSTIFMMMMMMMINVH